MSRRAQTPTKRISEEADPPYIPDVDGGSTSPRFTPRKRLKVGSSVPTAARANARSDILRTRGAQLPGEGETGVICVVSNASNRMEMVEYSHVTGKATPYSTLDRIEWVWDMEYFSLNLNTRKNIQTLTVAIHKWFDASKGEGWLWVPVDLDILVEMHEKYVKQGATRYDPKKIYGQNNHFTYKLVAHQSMKQAWSLRRYTGSYDTFESSSITQYGYPFISFPSTTMHVHPHFVICNTGQKLVEVFGDEERPDFSATYATGPFVGGYLQYVLDIYRKWMSSIPSQSFLNGENPMPGSEDTGLEDEYSGPSSGEDVPRGRDTSKAGSAGQRRGRRGSGDVDAGTIMPDDSISFVEDPVDYIERVDTEYAEEDDEEFFQGVERWAEDVWKETMADADMGSSDSEHTLVDFVDGKKVELETSLKGQCEDRGLSPGEKGQRIVGLLPLVA